jgi:hypothetical protein
MGVGEWTRRDNRYGRLDERLSTHSAKGDQILDTVRDIRLPMAVSFMVTESGW